MNQHELTRGIGTAWMAKAAVAAICAGVTLAAHAAATAVFTVIAATPFLVFLCRLIVLPHLLIEDTF